MKIENPNPNENTNQIKFSAAIENLSPVLPAYPTKAMLKIRQGNFSTAKVLDVPGFEKKEMKTIETSYSLPQSGNYTHTLVLNYDQAIPEADRSNNTTTKNVQIQLLPDLLLYVHVSDRTPRIFKRTHFEIDVKNIGRETSVPVNMSFRLKGKDTNNYTIPALKPKQTFHVKRGAKYGTKGSRNWRVRVDTQKALAETTKTNNVKTGSIRVLLPTDFDSSGLELCDIEPVIVTSGKARVNRFYPITVKVRQLGTRKSSGSIIRYRVPDENIQKDYMLPEILPGETYTAVYRIKWTSAGTKKFEVQVDPNQSIKNERHVNNKKEKSVTVIH
jgi:subtilase family serine protease